MPKNRFLIDAAFIAERAHKTFCGTPLMTAAGNDHTFMFGCVRDFLRLRRHLDIKAGVMILGKDTYSVSSRDSVLDLIVILKELEIPYVHDSLNPGFQVIGNIRSKFSHIVTANKRCLQFCTDDLIVVLTPESKQSEWQWISSDAVNTILGIAPKHVPTFLALTEPGKGTALTSKQAIRLVELYGDIDSIYENLAQVQSGQIRKRLAECESAIRQCYVENMCGSVEGSTCDSVQEDSLKELDTANNRQLLISYGFHSLLPLLANSLDICPDDSPGHPPPSESYHAVVDRKGMQKLESVVRASKLCAIDTETDGKDPREATLLGISFSVKDEEAYFIPLIERDLKGLSRNDALKVLRRIFNSDVEFIGHNIKYDCLMLRRAGVTIKRVHFDTMLAAYDCHGDWPFFNLPYLCKRCLGKKISSYSDMVADGTFLDLPLRDMVHHACQDADMTLRLYPVLLTQLQERKITKQFFDLTMALLQRLAHVEFDGIAVSLSRVGRIKKRLSDQVTRLSTEIFKMVGNKFDIESHQALSEVVGKLASLGGYVGPQRMTVSALEHLAIVEPVVRLIVNVKRLRKQVARLEAIAAAVRDGKIYPLFNQIRSPAGVLASIGPNMFDSEGLHELKSCFDGRAQDLFVDTRASLRTLSELTNDPVLTSAMTRKSKVDPAIAAQHPLMREIDPDELLLRLAVGQSDAALSKRFLVDRLKIATMRNVMEKRYQVMFRWLNSFRHLVRTKGYATNGDLRKYIDGLKSSDVARRGQALEQAIRWLICY